MHQDLKSAARNVNYWSGVTTLMPLLGGFVADAYLGRYATVFISSIIYLMGLFLLTLSWFLPCLKPCDHADMCNEPRRIHEVAFFLAIYLISIGTGGHKPSLESFGADQFDEDHPEERLQKMSFFNWWNCALCSGLILGVTLIVYVQDNVSWGIADIIFTAVMAFSLLIFLIGKPFYRYKKPIGSPLTPLLPVLVAAFSKRKLPYPSNPDVQLYQVPKSYGSNRKGRILCHTKKLKFLDKAAILENDGYLAEKENPWKLATVTKVEEMKLIINMIPIWVFTIPFGICVAQTSTFFVKQGATLNRKIGNGFEIPPASIFTVAAFGMIVSVAMYDKILVPILRRVTGNERGINILQRIGFGMVFSISTMIVAAITEKKRLKAIEISRDSPSMSVFWLAPQFLIIGFGDGFTLVGLQEYFYDQVPDSMRSLGIAFYLSVIGAANFLSSMLITVVDHVTMEKKSGKSWFGKDLNSSRLDKFYWLLAAIATVNLFLFMFFASRYSYKNVQKVVVADCYDEGKSDCGVDGLGPVVV
ncbi:hypothetical protein PIB30_014780 [Stylosanthes scabra]|uniref:Uncharacterized protein n=1 Tax=Stylosanthes scabra TaxID=79078 RepID=A0ABU6Z8I3_9FABA|nr:hypothetical protein [Stylosanthes scabra]